VSNIPVKTNPTRRPLAHRIGAALGTAIAAAAGILLILVIAWGCIAVAREIIGA
jgi:hypothetical protein